MRDSRQPCVVEDPCTPRNFRHENRETSGMPAGHDDGRPAGEGLGRTARMDVPEESDSGIATYESFEPRWETVEGE